MASLKWLAFAAGAPKLLNEYVVDPIKSGYGLYSAIRDDMDKQRTQETEREVLSDYARATGPEDVDFIRRTATSYGPMDTVTAYNLDKYGKEQRSRYDEEASRADLPNALSEFSSIALKDPSQPIGSAFMRMKPESQSVLVRTLKGGLDDFTKAMSMGAGDARKAAEDARKQASMSEFQSAIGGLSGPSTSPVELRRFAQRGGYAPLSDVESDIRQAAAAYGVADSDEINKAIARTQDLYKNTYLSPETVQVGRTTATGQRNLMGDFRKDVQSVAPVVNVTMQGQRERQREFSNEQGLRKEFLSLPEVKEYPTVEAQSQRALKALSEQGKGTNVAVDQSIITIFNKMLDPSSVVRESEYARTPQDLALLSRIKGKWDKITQGGAGLAPDERAALNRMVKNFSVIASQQYNARVNEYKGLARDYGYNPERVVPRKNALPAEDKPPSPPVAPAGTRIKTKAGKILTSDGKGGWR